MPKNEPKISGGHYLESAVLGEVSKEYGYDFEGENFEEHEDYNPAVLIEVAKDYQPWPDPCNPEKPFPRDLLDTTAYYLGLPDGSKQLRYFTTVNSHLDWGEKGKRSGFDAFLELDMGNGESVICRLDISGNDKKISEEDGVSDWGNKIVFHWPEDGISQKTEGKKWMDKVNQVAQAASEKIRVNALRSGGTVRELSEYELEESKKIAEVRHQAIVKTLPSAEE